MAGGFVGVTVAAGGEGGGGGGVWWGEGGRGRVWGI